MGGSMEPKEETVENVPPADLERERSFKDFKLKSSISYVKLKRTVSIVTSARRATSSTGRRASLALSKTFSFVESNIAAAKADKQILNEQKSARRCTIALFILHKDRQPRKCICRLADYYIFDWFITLVIVANCCALAAYDPVNVDSDRNKGLEKAEYVFLGVFIVEMLIRIVADGFIRSPNSYIRSPWNILDFTIVIMGIFSIIASSVGVSVVNVKSLRAFRVMRPLRLVSKLPALQAVMNSILCSIPQLLNVVVFLFFLIFLWAITGLQLFSGSFHTSCYWADDQTPVNPWEFCHANDNSTCSMGQYCNPKSIGLQYGVNSYDNAFLAILTTFQCITTEGWSDIMWALQRDVSSWSWLYFVPLIILGSFFTINLFVGVLSGEFSRQRDKQRKRMKILRQRSLSLKKKKSSARIEGSHTVAASIANLSGTTTTDLFNERKQDTTHMSHFRRRATETIYSDSFRWFIVLAIILNTIVLAMDYYGASASYRNALDIAEICFAAFFLGEMIFKISILGFGPFWNVPFNRFDFFIISASIIEMIVVKSTGSKSLGINAWRSFRYLLAFKNTGIWQSLIRLVRSVLRSFASIGSLIFLEILFVIVFALLGMQVFGGRFNFDNGHPRVNFDSFYNAFISVFQMFTSENWNNVMYDGVRAYGSADSAACLFSLYFVAVYMIGNFILLNVFLAIALDNIGEDDLKPSMETLLKLEKASENALGDQKQDETVEVDLEAQAKTPGNNSVLSEVQEWDRTCLLSPKRWWKIVCKRNYALGFFSTENFIRKTCLRVLSLRYWESFIMFSIILSSLVLALEDPLHDDSPRNRALKYFDIVLTLIFLVEMMLKIIVMCFLLYPTAYLRSGWNIIDAVVVVTSVISLTISASQLSVVKVIRVIRVLRPLRAIKRLTGLKKVIGTLSRSFKAVGSVVIVIVTFCVVYAIMGVQLFQGSFGSCNDSSIEYRVNCTGNFTIHSLNETRYWETFPFNFNNVGVGLLTLFTMSTAESWNDIMYTGVDATSPDRSSEEGYNKAAALFFISFLLIITFLLVNVFVGFVIVQYQMEEEESYQRCKLDKRTRNCFRFALLSNPVKRYVVDRRQKWRYRCYKLVNCKTFEISMIVIILLNVLVLSMNYDGSSEDYILSLKICNYIFTGIFSVEALLYIYAFTPAVYFTSGFMVFDFIIVLGSVVDACSSGVINVSVFRMFRVSRVLKLIKSPGIRNILFTLVRSLPYFPWVTLLLGLVFFIYAIVGMNLFAKVMVYQGGALNPDVNFQSFGSSLLLLFRAATGEGWQYVMVACAVTTSDHPPCDPNAPEGNNCGSFLAYPYFISFLVMCKFLVLNLFVAIILDNFDYMRREVTELGTHHFPEFQEKWSFYDPQAKGYISRYELISLLRLMEPPLGIGRFASKEHVCKMMLLCDININHNNMVQYNAALFALVRLQLKVRVSISELRLRLKGISSEMTDEVILRALPYKEEDENTIHKSSQLYAAEMIQCCFRRWKELSKKRRRKTDCAPVESNRRPSKDFRFGHFLKTASTTSNCSKSCEDEAPTPENNCT